MEPGPEPVLPVLPVAPFELGFPKPPPFEEPLQAATSGAEIRAASAIDARAFLISPGKSEARAIHGVAMGTGTFRVRTPICEVAGARAPDSAGGETKQSVTRVPEPVSMTAVAAPFEAATESLRSH